MAKEMHPDAQTILSERCGWDVRADDCEYYSWPKTYPTTAGPFGGAAGQAFTVYQHHAYECCGWVVELAGGRVYRVYRGGVRVETIRQEGGEA